MEHRDADTAAPPPRTSRVVCVSDGAANYASVDDHIAWGVLEDGLPKPRQALLVRSNEG